MTKRIYRDFDHWWQQGKHPWSSASYEIAKKIWDDLEPTIQASRDDYKDSFVALAKEVAEDRSIHVQMLLRYIEEFVPKDAPKFGYWWSKQIDKLSEPCPTCHAPAHEYCKMICSNGRNARSS